jgi:hypothetical protein
MGFGRFFSLLMLFAIGRTPWTGDQPVTKPLLTRTQKQHKQNKFAQTFTSIAGFEPTTPAFELAKTFRALDRAITVVGFEIPQGI